MVVMTAPAMRVFDLKLREYSNKTKAYTFSASELKPNKKGIWGKYYMRVQSEIVPKFERLKIRNGSIVDIVATPNYYVGKDGKYGMEWEVKDISISISPILPSRKKQTQIAEMHHLMQGKRKKRH